MDKRFSSGIGIDTPTADLYTFESESGKIYKVAEFELINTQSGYKKAKDVLETDTIIENDLSHPPVIRYDITKQADGHYTLPLNILFETSDLKEIYNEVGKN